MKKLNLEMGCFHHFIILSQALIVVGFLFHATDGLTQNVPPGLMIATVGTNQLSITITNGISTGNYEVWWTPVLGDLVNHPWTMAAAGTGGQTNFTMNMGGNQAGFFRVSQAPSIGASTPFISYEAESGSVGSGATVVALTSPPTSELSSPQLEASGHAYVHLAGIGQSVTLTNNTGKSIDALNVRYSIPDSATGGGISNTIDLYVGGTFCMQIPVNSFQTWVYETTSSYNGMSQDPSTGSPHVFWDEVSFFVPGNGIPVGSTFTLQMDATNTAAYYDIDVVDLETPPPPSSPPSGSLSIMTYGAMSNNPSFDNSTALQNCFNDALAQNKIVWIPPGKFYISNGGALQPRAITIQGAGPWYSSIVCTKANWANGFMIHGITTSFKDICLDSPMPNSTPGMYAILAYGANWTIDNVWSKHMMLFWGSGTNAVVKNSRVNNSWGDGMQINNVLSQGCTNILIYNNFSRGNGDDAIAVDSASTAEPPVTTCTVMNNTTVASWWANQMGVYGGINVTIASNLFLDCVKKTGIELNAGFGALPPVGQTAINNTLIRCGSFGYAINQPAIIVEGGGTNTTVSNNTITDAMFEGVEIDSTWNLLLQSNLITAPGTMGITIDSGNSGSGNFNYNTVTNLQSGQTAYINNSPSTFTATLVSNSWLQAASSILSQGEPVTADSSQTGSGNIAANGNDGSQSTRWAANDNLYPHWWRVDLGTNYNLNAATIDWFGTGGRSYQYKIDVSTDDINYVTAVDKTGNTSKSNTTDTFTATARYIRIMVTGVVPSGGNASFYECMVYGNIAP